MSKLSPKEKFQNFYHNHQGFWDFIVRMKWRYFKVRMYLIDDETFQKKKFKKIFGKELNLENPSRLEEKQLYIKLHNRDPLITICSDKVRARDYVREHGCEDILIPQVGVYKDARDIPFDSFDRPVFLKCNHMSGANKIYDPANPFDRKAFIKKFNFLLKQNQYWASREWNYKDIKPLIECEEVLHCKDGSLPKDYKFYCFGGKPVFLGLSIGTCDEKGEHALDSARYFNTYDMDFKQLDIDQGHPILWDGSVKKPSSYDKMKEVCEKLAAPFPFVRVDLYDVDGHVYFGELTFYDDGGFGRIEPEEWNKKMAEKIDLSGAIR